MDWNNFFRFFACILGLILSVYAFHVETTKAHDLKYKAMCDINEHMSCSKVFTSRFGTGFGLIEPIFGKDSPLNVPNSIYGLLFYILVIIMGFFKTSKLLTQLMFLATVVACVGCVYLAYILYFVLHDFCVVCVSTYVVNFFLLFINYKRLSTVSSLKKKKE